MIDMFCPLEVWNLYLYELNARNIPIENLRFNLPCGPTVKDIVKRGDYVEIRPNHNGYNNYVRRVLEVIGPIRLPGIPEHYTIVIDTNVHQEHKKISRGLWNEVVSVNGNLRTLCADNPTTWKVVKQTKEITKIYNHGLNSEVEGKV